MTAKTTILPPAYIDGQHLVSVEGSRLSWAWEMKSGDKILGFYWSRYTASNTSNHGVRSRKVYPSVEAALQASAKAMRHRIVPATK